MNRPFQHLKPTSLVTVVALHITLVGDKVSVTPRIVFATMFVAA